MSQRRAGREGGVGREGRVRGGHQRPPHLSAPSRLPLGRPQQGQETAQQQGAAWVVSVAQPVLVGSQTEQEQEALACRAEDLGSLDGVPQVQVQLVEQPS